MLTRQTLKFAAILNLALPVILMLVTSPMAEAKLYDFATLDVQPVAREGAQNKSWFVEYLQPGQQLQEKLLVSNLSTENKELEIYVADSNESKNQNFSVKTPQEKSEDIAEWITLPTQSLSIAAGETKILSVNFILPKNAGVGLHSGAIMVREKAQALNNGAETNIAIEKGVRVYLNVTGSAITKAEIKNFNLTESPKTLTTDITLKNLGTTDFNSSYDLELTTITGNLFQSVHFEDKVKPTTTETHSINMAKPSFGLYQLSLNFQDKNYPLKTMLFIPLWMVGAALALGVVVLKFAGKKAFNNFVIFSRQLQLQKSAVYFGLFLVIATVTSYGFDVNTQDIKSQVLGTNLPSSYELTVKWGNLRQLPLPASYKKGWEGKFIVTNGTISIKDLLNFEKGDTAQLTNNGRALKFNVKTGPDNDGIVLKITPTGETAPTITYQNTATGENTDFEITDFLNTAGIFPDALFATSIETKLSAGNNSSEIIEEQEASSNATTITSNAQLELENLFIEDLPASSEALSDFILSSEYIEDFSTVNGIAQVETEKILIDVLEGSSDVIEQIAREPDLNYVFIPTETITFPPQDFSFDQTQLSSQELGTMIFVQNKDTPWNTYLGTSDFISLSGKGTIPASALTVVPGEIEVLNQDEGSQNIEAGKIRTFRGTYDKSTLVDVQPENDITQIFTLNPTLEVRIPPGTLPGRYRGTLTITSL